MSPNSLLPPRKQIQVITPEDGRKAFKGIFTPRQAMQLAAIGERNR